MKTAESHRWEQDLGIVILMGTPDLVFVMNDTCHLIMANDSLLKIWGQPLEALTGKYLAEIEIEPRQAEMIEREVKQVIDSGNPARVELTFQDAEHGQRNYDCILIPLHDDGQHVKAVAGIARDLTEIKERKQFKSYNRLKNVLDGADAGAWEMNLDDRFLWRSFKHDQLFGYESPVTDWSFEKFMEHVLPEDREWVERKFQKIREDRGEWELECRIRRLDGEVRWIRTKGKFIQRKNQPDKVAGTTIDITDRKQIEQERDQLLQELKNERKQLEEIFEQSPSYMAILRGPDHVYVRINEHYKKMATKPDVVGKPVRTALPELEEQGLIEVLDHTYQTGEIYKRSEVPLKIGGKQRYLHLTFLPLHDPDGAINGIFFQGVDVTERMLAQKELQAINKTLEERVEERTQSLMSYQEQLRSLTSRLSSMEKDERHRLATELHDNLGQMLAIGKMKLNQLKKSQITSQSASQISELIDIMTESIRFTRELMTDLKAPSSIDKGGLQEALVWLAEKMEKYDLQVTLEDDDQPKPLNEEVRTVLVRCVRELLFNVVKHADVQEAKICVVRKADQVQVLIADEGAGFDPGDKPDGAEGFGLFSIREHMDRLGGSFKVISAPGKGTKAILTVPVEEEKQPT